MVTRPENQVVCFREDDQFFMIFGNGHQVFSFQENTQTDGHFWVFSSSSPSTVGGEGASGAARSVLAKRKPQVPTRCFGRTVANTSERTSDELL